MQAIRESATGNSPSVLPVEMAIQTQRVTIDELYTSIANLEERLRTILGPSQPQGVNKTKQETAPKLSHILEEHNRMIRVAMEGLHDIMQRLEI